MKVIDMYHLDFANCKVKIHELEQAEDLVVFTQDLHSLQSLLYQYEIHIDQQRRSFGNNFPDCLLLLVFAFTGWDKKGHKSSFFTLSQVCRSWRSAARSSRAHCVLGGGPLRSVRHLDARSFRSITTDEKQLFVSNNKAPFIHVFNYDGREQRTIPLDQPCASMTVRGPHLYLSQRDVIAEYNLHTNLIVQSTRSRNDTGMVIQENQLFVGNYYSGLYAVNANQLEGQRRIISQSRDEPNLCGAEGVAMFQDQLFVADTGNQRIKVFDLTGKLLRSWDTRETPVQYLSVSDKGLVWGVHYAYPNLFVFRSDTGALVDWFKISGKIYCHGIACVGEKVFLVGEGLWQLQS